MPAGQRLEAADQSQKLQAISASFRFRVFDLNRVSTVARFERKTPPAALVVRIGPRGRRK